MKLNCNECSFETDDRAAAMAHVSGKQHAVIEIVPLAPPVLPERPYRAIAELQDWATKTERS